MVARVKLKDIAEYTGCAVSTVSAALNGPGRGNPEKVRMIRRAAEQMGFRPNLAARLLKDNDVDIFGLVISADLERLAGHGVFSELQEKFLSECGANGIRTQFELDRTMTVPAMFSDGIAKGILHAGVICESLHDWLERNPHFPVVAFEESWKYCVKTDFKTGVYMAVQHLAATGHKRIGLFCGPEKYDTNAQMQEGFLKGCRDFGREFQPELIRHHAPLAGEAHYRECARHIHELFSGKNRPDAMIAGGQGFCAVAIYELPRIGLRVPEDVSLISACSTWEAERVYPRLTNIERNSNLLVLKALKILRQLSRSMIPEEPQALVPAELVLRNSVASRF